MSNVGYATLTVLPSAKGFAGALGGEINGPLASAGHDGGKKAGGGFVSAFKGLVGPAMALAGTVGFAGFIKEAAAASDATDKFKSTMSFAGLDTSAIDNATKSAKNYADQTVYDLPTIQNMIAQLASNGVSDYTGLTEAAGNLNAVAGGNADTFKSVAMVMTQTAGAGKLTTENWNQMADAIPGAAGPLMKAMKDAGAYTGNFRDAMADGQITSDEFNAALMKLGKDPVAVEAARSTKTFEGAIGNLEASINSGLMTALDAIKPAATGVINAAASGVSWLTDKIAGLGPIVSPVFARIGDAARGLFDLFAKGDFSQSLAKAFNVTEDSAFVDFLFNARDAVLDFWGGFTVGVDALGSSQSTLAHWGAAIYGVLDQARGGITAFFEAFKAGDGDITSSGFAGFMEQLGNTARQVFDALGPAFSGLFSALASSIGPLIPQIIGLWTNLSPLGMVFQAIAPFLPTLVSLFGTLASVIATGLGAAIQGILPAVSILQQTIVGVLGQALTTIIPVVVQLVGMLATTFANLIPVVVPIISTIMTLAATLISQLAPIIMNLVSAVLPTIVDAFGMVLGAIGPVISTVAGVLVPVIQALMPVVVTVFSVIADVIRNAMQIVQGIIQVVTGIISGNWRQVWSGIQNIFGGIWNTIGSIVRGAISIVGSVISAGLNLVRSVFSNVWNGVVSFLGGVWGNITSGVSGMIGNVVNFFGGLLGKITGAIGNAAGALFSIGQNIIQGLLDGIGSMMGAIGRAILSIVPGPIVGVFKDLLGIHSPSRVFRGFGVNIGEGLILGIQDKYGDVAKTVASLADIPASASISGPTIAAGGVAGAVAALAGHAGVGGPQIVQENHFNTPMDEQTYAELAARRLLRAGVAK